MNRSMSQRGLRPIRATVTPDILRFAWITARPIAVPVRQVPMPRREPKPKY